MFELTDKNKTNSCLKITLFAQIFQKIREDSFNKLLDKFDLLNTARVTMLGPTL